MHYNQLCLHLLIRNSVTRLDDFNIFNYFISTKVAQNVCWLLGLFKICHFWSKTDVITYWATFENLGYILFQNLVTLHLGHRDNVAFTKAKEAPMQVAFTTSGTWRSSTTTRSCCPSVRGRRGQRTWSEPGINAKNSFCSCHCKQHT